MKVESYEQIVEYLADKRKKKRLSMVKFEDLHGLAKNTCFYFESKRRVLGLGTLLPVLKAYGCTLYINSVALMDTMQLVGLLEAEMRKRGLSGLGLARLIGFKSLDLCSYRNGYTPRTTRFLKICKALEWEVEIDG